MQSRHRTFSVMFTLLILNRNNTITWTTSINNTYPVYGSAYYCVTLGVNISERKSGTERTKKAEKEGVRFSTTWGATGTVLHRLDSRRYTDVARATITRDIFTRPGLSGSLTYRHTHILWQIYTWHDQTVILCYETHSFRIIDVPCCNNMLPSSQSELALPSAGSWLPSRWVPIDADQSGTWAT